MHSLRLFFALLCVLITLGMTSAPVPSTQALKSSAPPVETQALDADGEPLPAGALARLGTMRFRHDGSVTELALSPDGAILATSGFPGGISLWDMSTGRELRRYSDGRHVAFSPDGKLAAAVGNAVTVWNAATGKELYHLKDVGPFETLVFSPDRKWLAGAGQHHSGVCLWDAASGNKVPYFLGHHDIVRYVAFSPDGRRLASSSADGTIRVWDPAAPAELQRFALRPHVKHEKSAFWIPDLAFMPDGKSLAVWGYDEKLQLLDAVTGKVQRVLGDKQDDIGRVAFSPDGALMAWTTQNTMRLWNLATWKPVRQWPSPSCRALTFSPDGKTLVAGCGESRPRFWDVATGKELRTFAGHRRQVLALTFSDDGQRLFSGSSDASFRVWDWRAAREEAVWQLGVSTFLMSISRDGRKAAVASYAETKMNVWDLLTGTVQTLHVDNPPLRPPALSTNGKLVAWHDWNRTFHVWDAAERRELYRLADLGNNSGCLAFSPDGKLLAVADVFGDDSDSQLRFVVASTGKEIRRLPTEGNVLSIAFAPDGRVLATTTFDQGREGKVRLWDAATFREVGLLGCFDGHPSAHFSQDSRFLVLTGLWPDCARVLEVATGREVRRFDGNQAGIQSVAFSRDHRLLATGGGNSTIIVWDLTGRIKDGKLRETRLISKELDALWTELGGADAAKGQDAVWALVAAPEDAVDFLQTTLKPIAPADPARLGKLIRELGDERFAVRAEATGELGKLGERAEGALRRALKTEPPLEVRLRIERILAAIPKFPLTDPEHLQAVRGVQVLEYIGTPPARRLLEKLSEGVPEARVTQDARLALARLGKEKPAPPKNEKEALAAPSLHSPLQPQIKNPR